MKVDILAIGVHPDDIELGCAGTLLKHIDLGYTVGLVDLTEGELGTLGNATLRLQEAENARKILGAKFRWNLSMQDAFFEIEKDNILKIAKVIRLARPDIVLCNAIADRHPDHGRASKLISDACFYAGLRKIEIEENGVLLEHHRPKYVYHYIQDRNLKPDFCVDVTQYMEKKMESVMAFSSQFLNTSGPETPISSRKFHDFLYAKAKTYGRDMNVEYAEGFNVERTPAVEDLFDLK